MKTATLDEKWIVWAKTIAAPEENVALKKALQALYPQQPEPDECKPMTDRRSLSAVRSSALLEEAGAKMGAGTNGDLDRYEHNRPRLFPLTMYGDHLEQDEWCDRCQNTGYLDCHCGGDLCVCSNQGEYPCPDCG